MNAGHASVGANAFHMAASMAGQITQMVQGQRHTQAMAKQLLDAVVTRRVEAVQEQCAAILTLYGTQAKSCIVEKQAVSQALLNCRDVIKRLELGRRLDAIDMQLSEIRADAKLLFDKMGELVLAIGGGGFTVPLSLSQSLDLSGM